MHNHGLTDSFPEPESTAMYEVPLEVLEELRELRAAKHAIGNLIGRWREAGALYSERGGNALTASHYYDSALELERAMESYADNRTGGDEIGSDGPAAT